ncbi:MAG: ABC transporter substrate-binding protein [Desulfobacteraceae bacterium]|nr:ABC transporter substrate-binding protein [Desulfobacteraceae bacterium]
MKIWRICLISLYLSVFVFSSLTCFAETSSMSCLQKNFDEIVTILQSSSFKNMTEKEQQDQVYDKLNSSFDFKLISMLALGRNWKRFSTGQRNNFSKYFAKLIINVYLSKILGESLSGIRVDYIKAIDLKTKSNNRSDVYTIFHNGDYEIPVDYRMIQKKPNEWKIYDILIEGVSLAANYRDTYRAKSMIAPEIIINELKAKVEK